MDSPALPAQLVIAARVRATEALQSALTRVRRGKEASCPHSALVPIRYDARTYTTLKRDAGIAHLSTVAGRLKVPFDANPHARQILAEAVGFDSADLIPRGGHKRSRRGDCRLQATAETAPARRRVSFSFDTCQASNVVVS